LSLAPSERAGKKKDILIYLPSMEIIALQAEIIALFLFDLFFPVRIAQKLTLRNPKKFSSPFISLIISGNK